jgi:hypothetical protein
MNNTIIKYIIDAIGNVVFLAATTILTLILGSQPSIPVTFMVLSIALLCLSIAAIYLNWLSSPYYKSFANEEGSHQQIKNKLRKFSDYENLRICGTSCTSIFSLFDFYVEAMANGKSLHICILDPNAFNIIMLLDDCEKDKDEVVFQVRNNIENLEDKIDSEIFKLVKELSFSEQSYGKKIIESSILMWFEAHRLADKRVNGKLSNGLSVYLYNHLPTLKAWIFGDSELFIGGYGPMPGGAGINNPIHQIKGSNSEVISECKKTFNFLMNNDSTEKVERLEVYNAIVDSNNISNKKKNQVRPKPTL